MVKPIILSTILIGYFAVAPTLAQESGIYTATDALYRKGFELYERGKFGAAQKLFEKAIQQWGPEASHVKSDAEFYRAMCAIELTNADAEYLIGSFINSYPESQKVNLAFFEMGKLRYHEKDYTRAVSWFKRIDRNGLDPEKRPELQFMLGYSLFNLNDLDAASRVFFEIKDTDNKYSSPATYYYSHIAYLQKKYATALKGFEKLQNDETFAPVVPYYIAQLYYLQRQYQKVVEYAPPLLESSTTKRTPEIARVIGESHYRLKQYDKALPFLQQYLDKASNITRDDHYLVGFVNYLNRNFTEAAKYLERISTEDDSLSQNANYHLADCYLKLNDKNKARQAFALASKADFDPVIKEDALFNFAKITYELLYAPFNEAVEAFRRYIELYPNTPRTDEAYNYLVLAYSNTRNYKDALESLEKIRNQNASTKQAYQRVAFFRGIEQFQNLNYADAIDKFSLSLKFPDYNRVIQAQALYWRAESYYRTEQYQLAADGYSQFILSPGAINLTEYNMAHYNLGYANFKLKKYDDAIVWFRKYTSLCQNDKTVFVGDANNRIGDSFFIQRRYWAAVDYYDKAIALNTIDADYATFQRGFSLGLVERPEKKIESMRALLSKYPTSNFIDDAIFELAESHMILNQPEEAKKYYAKIERDYAGSSYYVKSLVQLGLIYYNSENPDSAAPYYKRVVEGFPGTPEAKNALVGIRNIYVDKGDVDSYFAYASNLGSLANISLAEKDSLSYIAAEKLYITGDCQKSNQAFEKYLSDFPKGSFALNASYYLGECYNRLGDTDKALESFNRVIQRQKNDFTEQALLNVSKLYTAKGMHDKAYESYSLLENLAEVKANLLEARVGKLKSASLLNRDEDVISASEKVLATEKLPFELERETRFKLAYALLNKQRLDDAFDQFVRVASNLKTREGAEAKYNLIRIKYLQNDLDKAESEVFSFAETNTPHQYWLAKSFILLADVYEKKDDFFQAKATLQSVIDGYEDTNDGIIDEATSRLNALVKAEKTKQTANPGDTIKIRLKNVVF